MLHFKVQTAAGTEDIYCNDFDESNPKEYWFIHHNKPPRIFQKANVVSLQEVKSLSDAAWQPLLNEGEEYRRFLRSKQLDQ